MTRTERIGRRERSAPWLDEYRITELSECDGEGFSRRTRVHRYEIPQVRIASTTRLPNLFLSSPVDIHSPYGLRGLSIDSEVCDRDETFVSRHNLCRRRLLGCGATLSERLEPAPHDARPLYAHQIARSMPKIRRTHRPDCKGMRRDQKNNHSRRTRLLVVTGGGAGCCSGQCQIQMNRQMQTRSSLAMYLRVRRGG